MPRQTRPAARPRSARGSEPAALELRLLGELELRRDGTVVPLPQSKKTRGLLAYLALTGRSHRRQRLCSLLWDVPDDPRGALRWSLSKLRPLVDDPGRPRLAADRESVSLELAGMRVDVLAVRERTARRHRGAGNGRAGGHRRGVPWRARRGPRPGRLSRVPGLVRRRARARPPAACCHSRCARYAAGARAGAGATACAGVDAGRPARRGRRDDAAASPRRGRAAARGRRVSSQCAAHVRGARRRRCGARRHLATPAGRRRVQNPRAARAIRER